MVLAFLVTAAIAASPQADEGSRILARSIEAHGGRARFDAITSWHVVAKRDTSQGLETYNEYLLRDSGGAVKTLLVKTQPEGTLVFGHDGERGFALTHGEPRGDLAADNEGYYRAHGEYYLRSLPFKWSDPGMRATYLGRETLEGRELDLVRIEASEGTGRAWNDVWVAAIDRATHLLFEARLTHQGDEQTWVTTPRSGPSSITYRYSDYRDVAGLLLSFRMEYFSGGNRTGENVVESFDLDTDVPASLFTTEHHRR